MSFNDSENSLDGGLPLRLYQFNRGLQYWCYCSGAAAVTFEQHTYQAIAGGLSNDGIQQSGDTSQDDLTITAPADITVAQPFRGVPPSETVMVRIYDMHRDQSDARLTYVGAIHSVKWPALDRCNIICQTRSSAMLSPGLTATYMKTCTALLGDARCAVNLDSYRVDTTIAAISGNNLTITDLAGFSDGYFTGGYVAWPVSSGDYERRYIEVHSGTELSIWGGTSGLNLNQSIRIFPGCDYQIATCDAKYNNAENFRGFPHLQGNSPFDGTQVW